MQVNKLAGYMREHGYTQESLAHESGVSRATISRLLAGNNVTIDQVSKIVKALKMPASTASEIFFEDFKPQN